MIVIVGGVASGKRTFARSLGFSADDMADAVLDKRPVIYNLQDLVSRTLATAGENVLQLGAFDVTKDLFEELRGKGCIICCEVGSGVVPADRAGRVARERTGRLVNQLAAEAALVVRMVCGLPLILKGNLPARSDI